MFPSGSTFWSQIAGVVEDFITPLTPIIRYALGLSLALAAVAIGLRLLRRQRASRVSAGTVGYARPGSVSPTATFRGSRAAFGSLNLREGIFSLQRAHLRTSDDEYPPELAAIRAELAEERAAIDTPAGEVDGPMYHSDIE